MFNFKKLFHGEDYGKVLVEEVIPVYHDYAKTANKTIYRLKKVLGENKAEFTEGYSKYTKIYNPNKFITQNGVPIKAYDDDFNKGEFDLTFKKDGYEVGQFYEFKGLGYLGNLNKYCRIKLVTDQYVVFDSGKHASLYNYDELARLIKEEIV